MTILLTLVISLLLMSCEFPPGVHPQPPLPDGTSRYNEPCNIDKGIICYREERTICIADDLAKPRDGGKCLCRGNQAHIIVIDAEVAKVYDHARANDPADISPEKLAEVLPFLIRRCTPFKVEGQPCDPPLPLPVPQVGYIHPLIYNPMASMIRPGEFANTGCMSHETLMECLVGQCVCYAEFVPEDGRSYQTEQNAQGLCETPTTDVVRFIDQDCTGHLIVCWPIEEVLCDGLTKKCICTDPSEEWFTGIENLHLQGIDGRCVPTRRHNSICNSDVFDWCSRKLGLKCYEGFCKCRMYPQMIWLSSERKCLIGQGQPCMTHESCATKFCYQNTCMRQVEHSLSCETGLDEQCSSGFCDNKVCRYRVNGTTSSGDRLESFDFLKIVSFVLPVSTSFQLRPN